MELVASISEGVILLSVVLQETGPITFVLQKMPHDKEDKFKVGIGLWVTVCLVVCVWFLSTFVRGRRQFHTNLHVIEEGLRRMQEEIESRQRERSISYGEDSQEFAEFFNKLNNSHSDEKLNPTATPGYPLNAVHVAPLELANDTTRRAKQKHLGEEHKRFVV
ncbi:hypothetical protein NQ318_016738 [Aromia moschata]|uniref:Uncharacterized protein n=1 Tax=Aromia moschata TaxID=1265417 RepID=A0AAV8XYT2_9CUCU|nr:hypothetical protein NQ318_016738 [Aromia moschata]